MALIGKLSSRNRNQKPEILIAAAALVVLVVAGWGVQGFLRQKALNGTYQCLTNMFTTSSPEVHFSASLWDLPEAFRQETVIIEDGQMTVEEGHGLKQVIYYKLSGSKFDGYQVENFGLLSKESGIWNSRGKVDADKVIKYKKDGKRLILDELWETNKPDTFFHFYTDCKGQ